MADEPTGPIAWGTPRLSTETRKQFWRVSRMNDGPVMIDELSIDELRGMHRIAKGQLFILGQIEGVTTELPSEMQAAFDQLANNARKFLELANTLPSLDTIEQVERMVELHGPGSLVTAFPRRPSA